MKIVATAITVLALASTAAMAQSPYAGMQGRSIKALSAQQIDDLRAGRGMGLALAAELNGYPGPMHVLELSDKLALSAAQKQRIQTLFETMKAEATPIGLSLIEQESALDRQFAGRSITSDALREATTKIGQTQAELRNAHLKYHLETAQILSPDQMKQYAQLRGYASDSPARHHRMH
ncbi:periplasmic heavy metal sensor [Bradyrhizobium sp. AUGA SZCCT0240]|uniref:Spy/CpxP family protein refolding chaperone n=1 Tax=unclassified Bradyrhizobium TaxID=2631580 RepID=UPI001BA8ED85|nr:MULTISPECIES: periplasmic heavy metal sensor [unclassified Bradyrhizobium]MBR1198075.1 periplasmic heavy metal sensor [Bradyrhizobium sp. AUGA SZCCT0158]MBR1243468.1 periplasmic heavy metal sensor [Bradyrhizobium sp. AUGA SZCCT0274]MBR1253287.1 periplasmic heavy metal sensor [Bradyrhizobium sp. AUGA SZCCT0240]